MNKGEGQLFSHCRQLLVDSVDPITVTDGLYQRHFISANQRKTMYDLSRSQLDRSIIWSSLYTLIPISCDLQHLLLVLLDAGYTEIALSIGQKLRLLECQPSDICRVYRTKTGDSGQRFAQKLFMNFKINTHNNAFVNPRQYCHEEAQKYKIQFERYRGGDEDVKKGIADKYVACLLAEIDSHIMLYTRQFPAYQLIKQLRDIIPETSNSNITQLSYESRVAMACALAGRENEGEEHLQQALGMSLMVGRCVEISNLLYIYVFNLLSLYEKCPTKQLRDKIIHIAEMGIQSVEDETDTIREFWFRIFVLRIIYCLLGLSYRGDPIYGIVIDKLSVIKAKQLLTEVDKQWKGIESRRKIMYYVAKARIAELEQHRGYKDTVLYFLNLAIDIGNDGEYGETQFVKHYASYFHPNGNCKAQKVIPSEGASINSFQAALQYGDSTTYSDIMNNLQLNVGKTSDTNCDNNEKILNPEYKDDIGANNSCSKSRYRQHMSNSNHTEQYCSSDFTVEDKVRTTSSNQTRVQVMETFGALQIYDNVITPHSTKTYEDTVLKALNINRPGLPFDNKISSRKPGQINDDTVLKKVQGIALKTTRSNENTLDATNDDTILKKAQGNNLNSTLSNENEGDSINDDTILKKVKENDLKSAVFNENTVPKWATYSTDIKEAFTGISEKESSSVIVKYDSKSDKDDTEIKKSCKENTHEKSIVSSVFQFDDTKVKDTSYSGMIHDNDQTSTKITKSGDANASSADIHHNNIDSIDIDSMPFYDIHQCDKD